MKRGDARRAWVWALVLTVAVAACEGDGAGNPAADVPAGTADTTLDPNGADAGADVAAPPLNEPCDGLTDSDCLEIYRDESVFYRRVSAYATLEYSDRDTMRTVVRLTDLFDAEVAADPSAFRYQFFGTDNYTFGGFASFAQITQSYIEVGSRRVVWEPVLELPDSWRVKEAYRIVLSPAGDES